MKAYRLAATDMRRKPLLRTMAVAAPRLFASTHFGQSKKHSPSPSLHLSQILTHNNSIHHLQQQQQQRNQLSKRTFTTSIPLSALNTEQIDVEHNDSFLLQKILVSESSFDGIRTSKALYVDKTRCDHITHLLTLTHSYSHLLTLTHS